MRGAVALLALVVPEARAALFFSEYGEGSGSKYLEIYNSGDSVVSLAAYGLQGRKTTGQYGSTAYIHSFPKGAVVQAGDVFVVCDLSAASAVLAQCDQLYKFGSDDGANYCLVSSGAANNIVYDCVGDYDSIVGSAGWDVCSEGTTKDATLVRKSKVTAGALWIDSATVNSCEWYRLPQNTITYVGSHPHPELDPSPTPKLAPGSQQSRRQLLQLPVGIPPPALAPAADLVLTPTPTTLPTTAKPTPLPPLPTLDVVLLALDPVLTPTPTTNPSLKPTTLPPLPDTNDVVLPAMDPVLTPTPTAAPSPKPTTTPTTTPTTPTATTATATATATPTPKPTLLPPLPTLDVVLPAVDPVLTPTPTKAPSPKPTTTPTAKPTTTPKTTPTPKPTNLPPLPTLDVVLPAMDPVLTPTPTTAPSPNRRICRLFLRSTWSCRPWTLSPIYF
ncbi:hypothetical protein M885DRAFT_323987 [Pelagophyceae sp. CCMP2097]|nr:hypothetical protein M885DRAFT_323987 [Pelagophyceae sp. CCMP2097]